VVLEELLGGGDQLLQELDSQEVRVTSILLGKLLVGEYSGRARG
jgi:hypothetical protein